MTSESLSIQQWRAILSKRRRSLCLPHSAHAIISSAFNKIVNSRRSLCWCLPETLFPDEVAHFNHRQNALNVPGPRPRVRTNVTTDMTEEFALKIDAALNFAKLGESADPLIRPIMLYYSCAHLCGVYSRQFFEWDKDNRHHGLSWHHALDVGKTVVKVENAGQFTRLATACFLLTGQPSAFTTLVTYSQPPTAHTEAGGYLAAFCANEIGNAVKKLTLSELVNFDFTGRMESVRQQHGFHKLNGLPTTALLLDVISLFVASSLARYDVIGWKSILDGKGNSFRLYFDDVFDRFHAAMIDVILAAIDNPFPNFDSNLIPFHATPYAASEIERRGD